MDEFNDDTIVVRGHKYVNPLSLTDVEQYISDIDNIVYANVNEINKLTFNRFFNEACFLIVNGIKVFQQGYFDCAFYSLRQSIEVSIGSVFLASSPKHWNKWNGKGKFEKAGMLKHLRKSELDFKDIESRLDQPFMQKLRDFEEKKANKYIHKQGIERFHCYRNGVDGIRSDIDKTITADFEEYLILCIGAVTIYRLIFDPLPILLMEEDMMMRSPDIMVEPFSDIFVSKYLGDDVVAAYKQSNLFQGYRNWFLSQELQNEAIFSIIHWQYVDISRLDEIESQMHLLSMYDRMALIVFMCSDKIPHTYLSNGCFHYSSNVKRKNDDISITFGADFFEGFFVSGDDFNNAFKKECYISRFLTGNEVNYIEHSEPFNNQEIEAIKYIISLVQEMYSKINNEWNELVENYSQKSQDGKPDKL